MSYTGFLVIGELAGHLGTGRVTAGLLLGAVFARFPWMSKGRLRIVGLLPQPVRRPLIISLLVLCLASFLLRADYVPALCTGLTTAFLLVYPWLRKTAFDRLRSLVSPFGFGRKTHDSADDRVIDAEFRERKE